MIRCHIPLDMTPFAAISGLKTQHPFYKSPKKNIPKIKAEEHYLILPAKTTPNKKVGDYHWTKD